MAGRIAPALQGAASRSACDRSVRVCDRVGVRSAPDFAAGELLPASMVCHYALLGSAAPFGAAPDLTILLVVRACRLLRVGLFHSTFIACDWSWHAGSGVRRSLFCPPATEAHCSQAQ